MSLSTAGALARPGTTASTTATSTTATSTTAPPGGGSARRRVRARLPAPRRWISPLVLVVAWQAASAAGVLPPDRLAAPLTVLRSAVDLAASGELTDAFAVSISRVAVGFTLGAAVGVLLGAVAGLSRWGEALVDPPVQMLRTLPFLGLIPLFILWFGIGEAPKIALVALGVAFPLYLNVHAGIRGADGRLLEAAEVLGFTRWERLRHVVAPAAVPQGLVGLRQGLAAAWLSLIIGEQVNADAGLGFLINNARDFLRTDVIVVGLLVYAALGLLTDAVVRLVERRVLRWRTTTRG
ncbi:sulfonate transport system permease protein [Streptoalloteichus tenebrarius]|uniref:Sulfonate transport system permease protein n=1 Tax=Streptoalloteichus tenebrarius (strain ATCC 17920 / DSM 40477 / JCM 4838 / CBS 697.72 / NBRC 16177 / NCIMB 11028 / NRRL B-12390 / A12253. 1 / ISP 5477) TaxID=1933 RepID=A0ABT1I2V7_STRSD|nr:sulfonate transport system permease protein [Streptoalloteichus tenebrarius]